MTASAHTSNQIELTKDGANLLARGFEALREGSLYLIAGYILSIISILAIAPIAYGLGLLSDHSIVDILGTINTIIAISFIAALFIIISIILLIIGLRKWAHSASLFKEFDSLRLRHGVGALYMLRAVEIAIISIIIIIIGIATESTAATIFGAILIIIAIILDFVGSVLFGSFLTEINTLRDRGLDIPEFNIIALLWLLSIPLSLITLGASFLVTLILIYVHAGDAMERMNFYYRQMSNLY